MSGKGFPVNLGSMGAGEVEDRGAGPGGGGGGTSTTPVPVSVANFPTVQTVQV
jgi:hypothetical protein